VGFGTSPLLNSRPKTSGFNRPSSNKGRKLKPFSKFTSFQQKTLLSSSINAEDGPDMPALRPNSALKK
jgi:hypothetical protein